MYLIDTNVISELRKKKQANPGILSFFEQSGPDRQLYLSSITIGELRRGAALIRHRGNIHQALLLEPWLDMLLREFKEKILEFDTEIAQVWGCLRAPHPENPIVKKIAATALVHDPVVVTRNTADFEGTGVLYINPCATTPN